VFSGVTPSWGTQQCRRSPSQSPGSPICPGTNPAAAAAAAHESLSPKEWKKFTEPSNKAWSECCFRSLL